MNNGVRFIMCIAIAVFLLPGHVFAASEDQCDCSFEVKGKVCNILNTITYDLPKELTSGNPTIRGMTFIYFDLLGGLDKSKCTNTIDGNAVYLKVLKEAVTTIPKKEMTLDKKTCASAKRYNMSITDPLGGSHLAALFCKPTPKKSKVGIGLPSASSLNRIGTTSVPKFIGRIISFSFGIIGMLALVMMVIAGILWMTAMGNAERQKKAGLIMVWTALSVIVMLSAYTIVNFFFEIFQ